MATVYLGRSEDQFWNMAPRVLISMIREWNEIEKQRAKMQAICTVAFTNGKDPDEFLGGKESKKASEEQMKKNARAFF